jgi:hypothetical protein
LEHLIIFIFLFNKNNLAFSIFLTLDPRLDPRAKYAILA